MKGIIVDIDKMSDSKELYSQKPKKVMFGFIYAIVVLFVGALIYSFFGKIEVTAQGAGIIRPNDRVSTVSGLVGGQIEQVNFMDGKQVNEGDVLLALDCTDLQTDLKNFEDTKLLTESEMKMTEKYIASIQQGRNLFSADTESDEYPWHVKYELYDVSVRDKQLSYAYEQELDMTKKLWLEKEISRQNDEMNGLALLKQSIESGTNRASGYPRYSYQYQVYESTLQGLDTSKAKDRETIEQDVSSDTRQLTIDFYSEQITGYKLLLESLENGENRFADKNSMYSLMYEEYAYLIEDAKQAHENAKLQLSMLKENRAAAAALQAEEMGEGAAVADGSAYEVTIAEKEVENKEKAISAQKTKALQEAKGLLAEAEQKKKELETSQDATPNKQTAMEQIEQSYDQTIEQKKLGLLQQAEETAQALKQERAANQAELEQLKSSLNKYEDIKTSSNEIIPVAYIRLQELQTHLDRKREYEQKLLELDYSIQKTQLDIEAATIKASRSGVVNTLTDVSRGDVLQAGTMVATIIPPEEQQYKVYIYMDDTNIAAIKPGDKVKYSVPALTRNQSNSLSGEVINISKDTKVQGDSQQALYLVEATLNRDELDGEEESASELAVGMQVKAQVVTEEKRILVYILEKIKIL